MSDAIEYGGQVDVILTDIKKSFDTVGGHITFLSEKTRITRCW